MELFNSQQYFRCHDAFESVWMDKKGEERHYYQGLIQIAVAFYKIKEEQNWRGAVSLLRSGSHYLGSVNSENVELDISQLCDITNKILELLIELGPDRISEIDTQKFPQLKYTN